MKLDSAATTCEICGREIVANRAEHFGGHLENARTSSSSSKGAADGELRRIALPEGEICRHRIRSMKSGRSSTSRVGIPARITWPRKSPSVLTKMSATEATMAWS
jgi:hypothetical protein